MERTRRNSAREFQPLAPGDASDSMPRVRGSSARELQVLPCNVGIDSPRASRMSQEDRSCATKPQELTTTPDPLPDSAASAEAATMLSECKLEATTPAQASSTQRSHCSVSPS